MTTYSIFTEPTPNREISEKNRTDIKELELKLIALEIGDILKKQSTDNSITINYNGNIQEFREKVEPVIKQIKRKSTKPIYLAPSPSNMYSYKKS